MTEGLDPFGGYLDEEGALERDMSAMEDVPGAPTWPIPPTSTTPVHTPPVGLNWTVVSQRLGIDERVLRHSGSIVLTGEYFPEAGYALDPNTMRARAVDVGDTALRPVYFIGKLVAAEVRIHRPLDAAIEPATRPIVRAPTGAIIGLFVDEHAAAGAKREILQGSLGSGVSVQTGPLGVELRVSRAELPGAVATVIASTGGAILSIGGVSTVSSGAPSGSPRSARPAVGTGGQPEAEQQPVPRGGTGATGDSTRP